MINDHYKEIDPIINDWVFLHDLALGKDSSGGQIRSVVVGKYVISLAPPAKGAIKVNFIHLTNDLKTKFLVTNKENLRDTLENLYDIAEKT